MAQPMSDFSKMDTVRVLANLDIMSAGHIAARRRAWAHLFIACGLIQKELPDPEKLTRERFMETAVRSKRRRRLRHQRKQRLILVRMWGAYARLRRVQQAIMSYREPVLGHLNLTKWFRNEPDRSPR